MVGARDARLHRGRRREPARPQRRPGLRPGARRAHRDRRHAARTGNAARLSRHALPRRRRGGGRHAGRACTRSGARLAQRPRSGAPPVNVDPTNILYSPVWTQSNAIENVTTVNYGDGLSTTIEDDASIALYGEYPGSIDTQLELLTNANARATQRLARLGLSALVDAGGAAHCSYGLAVGQELSLTELHHRHRARPSARSSRAGPTRFKATTGRSTSPHPTRYRAASSSPGSSFPLTLPGRTSSQRAGGSTQPPPTRSFRANERSTVGQTTRGLPGRRRPIPSRKAPPRFARSPRRSIRGSAQGTPPRSPRSMRAMAPRRPTERSRSSSRGAADRRNRAHL